MRSYDWPLQKPWRTCSQLFSANFCDRVLPVKLCDLRTSTSLALRRRTCEVWILFVRDAAHGAGIAMQGVLPLRVTQRFATILAVAPSYSFRQVRITGATLTRTGLCAICMDKLLSTLSVQPKTKCVMSQVSAMGRVLCFMTVQCTCNHSITRCSAAGVKNFVIIEM